MEPDRNSFVEIESGRLLRNAMRVSYQPKMEYPTEARRTQRSLRPQPKETHHGDTENTEKIKS
jgi:hypothetical protein